MVGVNAATRGAIIRLFLAVDDFNNEKMVVKVKTK
jgi:hypothetical protein